MMFDILTYAINKKLIPSAVETANIAAA